MIVHTPIEVKITEMKRGKGWRQKSIYVKLVDANTGELLISADLPYVLEAIVDRDYSVVNQAAFNIMMAGLIRGE